MGVQVMAVAITTRTVLSRVSVLIHGLGNVILEAENSKEWEPSKVLSELRQNVSLYKII